MKTLYSGMDKSSTSYRRSYLQKSEQVWAFTKIHQEDEPQTFLFSQAATVNRNATRHWPFGNVKCQYKNFRKLRTDKW